MAKYRMATLFSGAGGLDTAFEESKNFDLVFANDVLSAPAESYSKNFSHKIVDASEFGKGTKLPAYVVGDVTSIDFSPIGKVDCMIGGPPCQDFSITRGGKRSGINPASNVKKKAEVSRGRLYMEYVRAVKSAEPRFFAFENVPGLMSANDGLAYETIVSDFASHGYKILFKDIANATKVGVPQTRRRLIILGARNGATEKLPDIEERVQDILNGAGSLVSKYPICAMEALEGKTVPELADRYGKVMKQYEGVEDETKTDDAKRWKKNVWDNLTFNAVDDYLTANGIKKTDDAEVKKAFEEHRKILEQLGYYGRDVHGRKFEDGSNDIPNEAVSVTERMKRIPPGMNHLVVAGTEWKVKAMMSNIYRRTDPLRPAFTVMAYGGGGTWSYHYDQERGVLTNRERARLQTFPDSYMFVGDRSQVRAQIGEAVPAQLGRKIAEIATLVLEQ